MNLNLTTATRVGLNIIAVLGAIIALRLGQSIFIPLVIAILLASILWPSANRLHDFYRIPWPIACAGAVGMLVVLNLIVTLGFVLAVPKLLQSLPNPRDPEAQKSFYTNFRKQIENVSPVPLDDTYLPPDPEKSAVFTYIQKTFEGDTVVTAVGHFMLYINSYLVQFVLILFFVLFLLLEGRMLTRRVVEITGPSREAQAKAVTALTDMAVVVRNFLVWRTVINIWLGIVLGVVFQFVFGLKQAWTWALLAGVLSYIPYLGPIIAGVPPLLDAFVSCPSPWYALWLLVFYTAIVTIEGYFVVPLLMGRHMNLNATTVMLACIFWEVVWGVPGLFLAMPLMAAVKAVCDQVPGWKPWANLMAATAVETGPPGSTLTPDGVPATVDMDRTVLMEEIEGAEITRK